MDANLQVALSRDSDTPLYRQLHDQIRDLIVAGRLRDGWRLPPERRLAETLAVNRSTVVNAYRGLQADGLLESRVGRGTTVRRNAAVEKAATPPKTSVWSQQMVRRSPTPHDPLLAEAYRLATREGVVSFVGAGPDPALYPVDAYRRTVDQVLATSGPAALEHCPVEGHYPLREAVASLMEEAGDPARPREIMVIGGSQEGLYLIARTLLDPGDRVVVEDPTYIGALDVFRSLGARIAGIPMDEDGLRVDLLEAELRRGRPRLIYVLPTHHNPTGRSLSLERRHELVQLASRHHVPVIEDDPLGWLSYRGSPLPSLRSLDHDGMVLYLSTFTEVLFPGLRLGWLAAPEPALRAVGATKRLIDPASNSLAQWSLAELCRQGLFAAHLGELRIACDRRLRAALEALRRYAPEGMTWVEPDGGVYLWCRLPPGLRTRDLLADTPSHRVAFLPGEVFYVEGGGQSELRLNFTSCPEALVGEGVRRLCEAISRLAGGSASHEHAALLPERPVV